MTKPCTVEHFKKILDSLVDSGFGNMTILLGNSTPLSEDSISINYLTNELLIRNTGYDKKLFDAADELKTRIDVAVKHYLAECYRAGRDVKED